MATSLVTLEENAELDGTKLGSNSATNSPTSALPPNSPLVRIGSKESVVTNRTIKIDDNIGNINVTIQGKQNKIL